VIVIASWTDCADCAERVCERVIDAGAKGLARGVKNRTFWGWRW
jgi:hypothetical protein